MLFYSISTDFVESVKLLLKMFRAFLHFPMIFRAFYMLCYVFFRLSFYFLFLLVLTCISYTLICFLYAHTYTMTLSILNHDIHFNSCNESYLSILTMLFVHIYLYTVSSLICTVCEVIDQQIICNKIIYLFLRNKNGGWKWYTWNSRIRHF